MDAVEQCRSEIRDYYDNNDCCEKYFHAPAHEVEFVAYYNSMYLLQDTTESLSQHRQQNFNSYHLQAYIEFWGVMQAVVIQQDSIGVLYTVLTGEKHKFWKDLEWWPQIRELRHTCAGHPAEKTRSGPLTRTFMGRQFGNYHEITYERWQQGQNPERDHPVVPLGHLLDQYAVEAESILRVAFEAMKNRWP